MFNRTEFDKLKDNLIASYKAYILMLENYSYEEMKKRLVRKHMDSLLADTNKRSAEFCLYLDTNVRPDSYQL